MKTQERPHDPLLQFLRVPYVCQYDAPKARTSFLDIPSFHGLSLEEVKNPSSSGLNSDAAAAFLQEWLFSAALNGICDLVGVPFDSEEFICSGTGTEKFLTGSSIRKYVWFWAGGLEVGTSTVEDRYKEQKEGASLI